MTPEETVLKVILENVVEFKEDVSIARTTDDMGVLLTLGLAKEDMGKIIGREGNTAKALRTILRVVGMTRNARVNLKILEPQA